MNKRGEVMKKSGMNKREEINLDNCLTEDIEKLVIDEKNQTLKKDRNKKILSLL